MYHNYLSLPLNLAIGFWYGGNRLYDADTGEQSVFVGIMKVEPVLTSNKYKQITRIYTMVLKQWSVGMSLVFI